MRKTGQPEIDSINAGWENLTGDLVREDVPYADTMGDKEHTQAEMVAFATQALTGETEITRGEDRGWSMPGGSHFLQPMVIKDGDGIPQFAVLVIPSPYILAENLQRILPFLVKRHPAGGVLRVGFRTDDDSLGYSNQPTMAQLALYGYQWIVDGLKAALRAASAGVGIGGKQEQQEPKDAPKPPMPAKPFTGFRPLKKK